MINKLIVLLYLISLIYSQNCGPPNPSQDLIDSGRLQLARRGGARQHCFTALVGYPIPITGRNPDVAISTSTISGYNPAGGFDYSVSAGRQGTSNSIAINFQINEDVRWVSIQISYLISSNERLIIGNFIGNLFPLTSCSGTSIQSTSVQFFISKWRLKDQSNYAVQGFISGYRTLDSSFAVSIARGDIDKVEGRLVFLINSNANPGLQYIYISYIIYVSDQSANSDFTISVLGSGQPSSSYQLQGPTSFLQNGFIIFNQLAVCRTRGGGGVTSCKQNQISTNNRCQCVRGFVRVNDVCRASCTSNGYLNQNRQCVCLTGFQFNQFGMCVPAPTCSQNQTLSQNTCVCKQGFYRSGRAICLPYCPAQNQAWNGATCVCAQGSFRAPNGACIKQINCQQNQILQGNICVCAPRFVRDSRGVCSLSVDCRRNQVNVGGVCQCSPGFTRNRGGNCRPNRNTINCQQNQVFNQQTGQCDCAPGFSRNGPFCFQVRCPQNQQFINGRCNCVSGWARLQNTCRQCPVGSFSNENKTSCICPANNVLITASQYICSPCPANSNVVSNACVCNQGFRFNNDRSACIQNLTCPPNLIPNPNGNNCICPPGTQWNQQANNCVGPNTPCPPNSSRNSRGVCECNIGFRFAPDNINCIAAVTCPQNGFIGPLGTCVCQDGFYLDSNTCRQVPRCPRNSVWNRDQLKCVCTLPGQYLINNNCQACPTNENWSVKDQACVCNQKFFRIQGTCRVCDINSNYNGTDCECNIGYFGNRDKCQKCDESCGKCTGPQANKCLTCPDISYTFANGYCTKNNPCPVGSFLDGSTCARCSDFCQICANLDQCGQCAPGFEIDLIISEQGTAMAYCKSICGDGRKVDIEKCDDGNKNNGDGCNSQCQVQEGWTCTGGTSIKPSLCSRGTPNRSIISVKGAVNLIGKVVQGVRLSFVPKCFTDRDCIDCYKIIDAKIIQGGIPVMTKVMYVPNSDGQFIVEYDFGSAITSTFYKYLIRINRNLPDQYVNCFSAEDYAQQLTGTIDTATLAKADRGSQLSLDDLNFNVNLPRNLNRTKPSGTSNLSASFGRNAPYEKTVLDMLDKIFST